MWAGQASSRTLHHENDDGEEMPIDEIK